MAAVTICSDFGAQKYKSNTVSTSISHEVNRPKIRLIIFFAAKDGEALYSQPKQAQKMTVAQIMNFLLPNSDLNEESRENH